MDPCPLKFAPPPVMAATTATRSVMSVTLSGHGDSTKVQYEKAAIAVRLRADLVEVEVFYCGLNFMDNYLRLGIIKRGDSPVIMGSECAGIIRRVGSDVKEFQPGEPVLCLRAQGGLFRRMVHLPPASCFRLPACVSLPRAVAMGLSSLVAYLCLFWFGRLQQGQTIFMQSIGGGVGTALVQMAKTVRGVTVLGTATKSKHIRLMSMGADRLYSHEEDYVEEVLEQYPEGIDMVINSNGAADVEKCTMLLKPFGRLITIGSNSSVTPSKPPCWLGRRKPAWSGGRVSSRLLVARHVRATGVSAGDFLLSKPRAAHWILQQVFRLHELHKLRPVVDRIIPISEMIPTPKTYMEQAVTLNGHGRFERIKVEDAPVSEDIEDDCVEVEVFYCGLNFTDNYLRLGIIRNTEFPVIMGSECSGIAPSAGCNVQDIEEGQRVLCLKMQGGLFHGIAHVPRKNCFPVPDDIRLIDAVALGLNYLVAYLCLFEKARLKIGQKVFMQSLGGGVGTAVVQLARLVPLVMVLGTASASKHRKLKGLGAHHVYRHDDRYVDKVLELYPAGMDVVINTNGGVDLEKCFKLLKPYGRLINIGSNSTAIYPNTKFWGFKIPSWDSREISTSRLVRRNCIVTGLNVGDYLENDTRKVQKILKIVFQLYKRDQIHPLIHSIFEFEQVVDGLTQLCQRENYGKVILSLQDEAARLEVPDYVISPPPKARR